MRALRRHLFLCLLATVSLFTVGCPHRSPTWSPDGKRILLLTGDKDESVEQAATRLWLIEAETGKSARVPPPIAGHRFFAVTWIDDRSFLAVTGEWDDDAAVEESGVLWRRELGSKSWKRLDLPTPSEERVPRRLPLVLSHGKKTRLAYPTGVETVTVVDLETSKTLRQLEPAEIVGPAPQGGLLLTRPDDATGGSVLVCLDQKLEERWSVDFAKLRGAFAKKLGKRPVEVVFNDTSTCHLPREKNASWIGVTFCFSDVGWRDGIAAYYARVDAGSGRVLSVCQAVGLSGRPESVGQHAFAVSAPNRKKKLTTKIHAFAVDTGTPKRSVDLAEIRKNQVHGYSLDPTGSRFALSLRTDKPTLTIYDAANLKIRRIVELE